MTFILTKLHAGSNITHFQVEWVHYEDILWLDISMYNLQLL